MIKLNGFDEAILGPALKRTDNVCKDVLVYDAEIIRKILMRGGMDSDEAREYIHFNIEDSYIGNDSPILVWTQDLWWSEEDLDWTAGNE